MSPQEILEMATALKASERFALVDRLLESLNYPGPTIGATWGKEA